MRQIAIVEFFFVIIALSPLFQLKFQSPTRAPLEEAAIGRAVDGQNLRPAPLLPAIRVRFPVALEKPVSGVGCQTSLSALTPRR